MALILTGTLCMGSTALLAGCQQTPVAEAVAYKEADIPQDALKGDSAPADPTLRNDAAEYTVQEHWDETIEKEDNFTITADAEVLIPNVDAYPVLKLEQRPLTEEMVAKIAEKLAPNAEFYAQDSRMTKADWEKEILNLKQMLEEDRANGDAELAASDEEALREAQEAYENAPETLEQVPADIAFTYQTDYEGNQMTEEGQRFINLVTDPGDGTYAAFHARKESEDMGEPAYVMYYDVDYQTESMDRIMLEQAEADREQLAEYDPESRAEEEARIESVKQIATANLQKYEANPIDLEAAKTQALTILDELDIPGLQVTSISKALFEPTKEGSNKDVYAAEEEYSLNEHGVYLELDRESGGIPVTNQQNASMPPSALEDQYSAPFFPEHAYMLLDEEGNVRVFGWESPAQPVEIVAPDSEILPFSNVKDFVTNTIYRNELGTSEEFIQAHGFQYFINEVQLQMAYVNAKDEPDKVLVIPVWAVKAQGWGADQEADGTPFNVQEISVSALDGTQVLMPQTLQTWTTTQ